jgi:hypothetical protein
MAMYTVLVEEGLSVVSNLRLIRMMIVMMDDQLRASPSSPECEPTR